MRSNNLTLINFGYDITTHCGESVAAPPYVHSIMFLLQLLSDVFICRGGVKDTTFETKAKDSKEMQGQEPTFRGQTHSRPSTQDLLRPRTKDTIFLNYGWQISHYY